jgi:hypothetical protein
VETWALRDDLETPLFEDPNEAEDEDEVGDGVAAVWPPDEFVVPFVVVPLLVDGAWVDESEGMDESDVKVVESTAFAALTVLPLYVAAASTPKPAEAASPARVVPMVRFRRRSVARDRSALPRRVKSFIPAWWAGQPFGWMTRTGEPPRIGCVRGCVRVAGPLRCGHPRSPRTGPVHVRFGDWMQGPATDRRDLRRSRWRR